MCAPLLAAAPMIAAGVSSAGSMLAGLGAMQQGTYESEVARQNAGLAIEQANDSAMRGRGERIAFFRHVGRAKGDQVAALAANGIDVGYGSALRMQEDTAALSREEAENLYSNIDERTRGHRISALNFVAEAKAAKYRGKQAFTASAFQAASSLAGGFSQMAEMKARLGKAR